MGMPDPQMVDRYGLELKLTAVNISESPGAFIKDFADVFVHTPIHFIEMTQAGARKSAGMQNAQGRPCFRHKF